MAGGFGCPALRDHGPAPSTAQASRLETDFCGGIRHALGSGVPPVLAEEIFFLHRINKWRQIQPWRSICFQQLVHSDHRHL
jgi:hypothetical protein